MLELLVRGHILVYLIFGLVVAGLGGGTLHGLRSQRDASGSWFVRHWKLLLVAFVLSLLVFVLYTAITTTGLLAMMTFFADDLRTDNFREMDEVFPTTTVEAGEETWKLAVDERPLPETYEYNGGERDVGEYLDRTETTGLVVAHGDTIVHESYYRGYEPDDRKTSWSVSKSVTSALVGIAIEEGHIESVEDPVVAYVSELEDSAYGDASIHDLLTMSSGVDWREDADGGGLFIDVLVFRESWRTLASQHELRESPGIQKHYASVNTMVLGLVVEDATGEPLQEYASDRLWKPAGMEGDATWVVDSTDTVVSMCCLNAQLRDYLRFGVLYLEDGEREGEQIVPTEWVETSTVPQPPHEAYEDGAVSFDEREYGYQWWIPRNSTSEFMASGLFGQYVYVDTDRDVVIARTATDPASGENLAETIAFFRSVSETAAED